MKEINCRALLILLLCFTNNIWAQKPALVWTKQSSLPDSLGFAGMFAGTIRDKVFCMGGANFPSGKPWEGGSKQWYDKIFILKKKQWVEIKEKLPFPLAYGVSVSCKNKIILVGGSNKIAHSNKVLVCSWNNKKLTIKNYPDLPIPLANMSGLVIDNLLIITGGSSLPSSIPLKTCLALNLNDIKSGWFEMESWPGPGRIFPVSAGYKGKYYLFSGETKDDNNKRLILRDAYRLTPKESSGKISGTWEKLEDMPKGISAGPSPAPYIKNWGFVFWGGVDRITALHADPITHPGIDKTVFAFDPEHETWKYVQKNNDILSRVTLPTVQFKGRWMYISGEIKPGIRTNTVYSIE